MSAEISGNGAERAENGVSGSGAVSGHARKRLSGGGAWGGRPLSGERVLEKAWALSGKSAAHASLTCSVPVHDHFVVTLLTLVKQCILHKCVARFVSDSWASCLSWLSLSNFNRGVLFAPLHGIGSPCGLVLGLLSLARAELPSDEWNDCSLRILL